MILDATCGLKQIWFQKGDEQTVYLDRRSGHIFNIYGVPKEYCHITNDLIRPDVIADNRFLPFKPDMFDMVVFDPPYYTGDGPKWGMDFQYDVLAPVTWKMDMIKTVKELLRVLKVGGFICFKWGSNQIPLDIVLECFPMPPLFGVHSKEKHTMYWTVFRKDA